VTLLVDVCLQVQIMGNFSKDAGTDAKADKNLKTSG
jgi:hypothetical protein